MHVTSVNVDSTGACGRKHLITVCVKLSGLKEMMTINVFVPHKRDDQAAQEWNMVSQEQKILARQFGSFS
jgi:hypothetical protein